MRHPRPPPDTVSLRPADGGPALECAVGNGGWCAILQTGIDDAQLPGVPAAWPLAGVLCRRVTLPCAHTFHISALALHFCVSDMRCPVCREGPRARLCLSSIPRAIRHQFRSEHASIETRAVAFDEAHCACPATVFTHPLYTGMRLVAEVFPAGSPSHKFTRFCSPVVCHPARGAERRYSLHRSFQRHVHSHMASLRSGTVRFTLSSHWLQFGTARAPLLVFDTPAPRRPQVELPLTQFPQCCVLGSVLLTRSPDATAIDLVLCDVELARLYADALC